MNYKSSILNELSSYQCELSYLEEKYNLLDKSNDDFLNYILEGLGSCIEDDIRLLSRKRDDRYLIGYSSNRHKMNQKCLGYDLTIYPVHTSDENSNIGHFTVLIVNHSLKEIEYYEPNGQPSWLTTVEPFLRKISVETYPNYKFIPNLDFCPVRGPQRVSRKGWCVAFSLLYILIRIKEPELTRSQIINDLLQGDRQQIRNILSKFICYTYDIIVTKGIYKFADYRRKISDLAINILTNMRISHYRYLNRGYFVSLFSDMITYVYDTFDYIDRDFDLNDLKNIHAKFVELNSNIQAVMNSIESNPRLSNIKSNYFRLVDIITGKGVLEEYHWFPAIQ